MIGIDLTLEINA